MPEGPISIPELCEVDHVVFWSVRISCRRHDYHALPAGVMKLGHEDLSCRLWRALMCHCWSSMPEPTLRVMAGTSAGCWAAAANSYQQSSMLSSALRVRNVCQHVIANSAVIEVATLDNHCCAYGDHFDKGMAAASMQGCGISSTLSKGWLAFREHKVANARGTSTVRHRDTWG